MEQSRSTAELQRKHSVWSIRDKVLGLVVVAATLPTALVGTSSYLAARKTLNEKLSDQLNSRASLNAARIIEWHQERRQDARVFAGSTIVVAHMARPREGKEWIGAYLQEVQGRYRVYRALAVLDPTGELVASAGSLDDLDVDRIANEPVGAGSTLDWGFRGAYLWVQSPIFGEDGRVLGRIALVCDFESLRELIGSGETVERLRITTDSHRLVFAHPRDPDPGTDFPGRLIEDGRIAELRDGRGEVALGVSHSLQAMDLQEPLRLTVTTDWDVAFASVTELRRRVLLLSAVAVVLVVALAYGLVLTLTDPLERLALRAHGVARGDYGSDLPVKSRDEIGYLTEVFNQMAATLKASHQHLERLSTTDELTQLINRRELRKALAEELHKAMVSNSPLTILMIDIDHFKAYNDRYGHLRGDGLLEKLGAYLRVSVPMGARAARYGGEEFLVLLPDMAAEQGVAVAEMLRTGFQENVVPEHVTLSLGVAAWWRDGRTAAELIDAADRALYEAKRRGRNRVEVAGAVSAMRKSGRARTSAAS